jgi:thioredoxin 1
MSGNIEVFTDQNWQQEVLESSTPVLVDFWAEWCAPCKAMVPDLEAIAGEYAGRVRVGKLNVEENQQVPFQYGITAMPTLIVLKGGQVVEQRVGKDGPRPAREAAGPDRLGSLRSRRPARAREVPPNRSCGGEYSFKERRRVDSRGARRAWPE